MLKIRSALLYFFLFFFIFSSNVNAYEIFVANPYFNDTNGNLSYGVVLYNPLYNNTFYYNQTCSGMTNCIIVENNGTTQHNSLWFQKYDWLYTGLNPQWSNITSLLEFSDNNAQSGIDYLETLLPANQEGLLIFNYRWNNTLTTPAPYLSVLDSLGNSVLFLYLNSTPNVWHNVSQIINASVSDRYLTLRMVWYWDNLPTKLEMDKFKFYTYDILETRTSFSSNFTYERNRYCGLSSSNKSYGGDVESYGPNLYNNTNGYLWATGEDGYECNVFKIGNIFIARRVFSQQIGGYAFENTYRDPFYLFVRIGTYTGSNYFLVTKLSITSAEIVPLRNVSAGAGEGISFWFNGIYTYVNITQVSGGTPQNNTGFYSYLPSYSRQTVNLVPWSNYTPPATQWKFIKGMFATVNFESAWHDFFSMPFFVCDPQLKCDPPNNSQYYQSSDCTYSNYQDCSYCGCNAELTGCDFPTLTGTYCDTNDTSNKGFITNFENCTSIYGQCGTNQICNQYTLTESVNSTLPFYTISCYNTQTGTQDFCIDTQGNNVTCSSIDDTIAEITGVNYPSQSTSSDVNVFNWLAMSLGSTMGLTKSSDLPVNQAMLALFISLFVSGSLAIPIKSKNYAEKIFGYSFVGLLFMFAVGLGNIYLYGIFASIVILVAGIMSGALQRMIGGGSP